MNQKDLIVGLSQVKYYTNDAMTTTEVKTITANVLAIMSYNQDFKDKFYRPILFTNEIFDSLNLVKIFKESGFNYCNYRLGFLEFGINSDSNIKIRIQYLHELQQLIWVLFKKEVRI